MAFEADLAKAHAARSAAELVQSGMIVGLGSGSTAGLLVKRLGERVAEEGLEFVGVPTSVSTAELARELNIPLRDVDDVPAVDLNIDGADEVDPEYRMIKGRGGALLREKLVACVASRRVTIVSPEKVVPRLGIDSPVPVEVSRLGYRHIEQRLRTLGARTSLRRGPDGAPFVTDGGNLIIDCGFSPLADPDTLEAGLKSVVGVFETGLFLGLCDVLVVGRPDGAEQIVTQARRWTGCT
ncbi:ribose-5-phosphate isomerase RpiA [Paludisphaera mucosa]|uniref:Ribose-5-phosphate isomerase A n=1 Tax=Paludisphaera mucosa TaxID=3030827 RepID=A0ABT6FHT9_9BACT|nr:ribose-5-phosphate isomerase RpiA [Paludisphaera mucosa]